MKVFSGIVKSTKMAKTATVAVERIVAHPIYKKRMKRTKLYQVHDEVGTKVGDVVKFVATKPVSKLKKWKIIEIANGKEEKKSVKRGKK